MLSVALVGYGVLLAQSSGVPSWSELGQLGVVALALIVGAAGTGWAVNKFGLQPMTKLHQQEREDRIKAQDAFVEAYKVTAPALAQANTNQAAMLDILRNRT